WLGLGCRADTLTVAGDHRLQSGAEVGPAVAYPDQVLLGVETLIWWQRHLFSRCCSIHRLMYQAAFWASWMALSLWPRRRMYLVALPRWYSSWKASITWMASSPPRW